MPLRVYPVVEGEPLGAHLSALSGSGKALSQFQEELDLLAGELNVSPPSRFLTVSREEALAIAGEEYVAEHESEADEDEDGWSIQGMQLWTRQPQWFAPEEGLQTVRRLRAHLQRQPKCIPAPDESQREALSEVLADLEAFLEVLARQGKRFHLLFSF